MGGLLGTLAFAIMGLVLVFGGVQTIRHGIEISKGKRITGPGALVLGVALVLAGIGAPVAAAVWLW